MWKNSDEHPNIEELINKEAEDSFKKKVHIIRSMSLAKRFFKSLRFILIGLAGIIAMIIYTLSNGGDGVFPTPILIYILAFALINSLIVVPIDHLVSKKGNLEKYLKMKSKLSYPIIYFFILIFIFYLFRNQIIIVLHNLNMLEFGIYIGGLINIVFIIWIIKIIISTYLIKK